LSPTRIEQFVHALSELGVAGGARAGGDHLSQVVSRRIRAELATISAAVLVGDADSVTAASARLLGLGAGLTPAGDDVLVGLAYAASQSRGVLAIVPAAVARALLPDRTTDLSVTMLRQACQGRAAAPLAELLAALRTGGADFRVRRAVATLTDIGHTSGTDQAYGVLAATFMTSEMRGQQCQRDPW
jgi:hypothetical protein